MEIPTEVLVGSEPCTLRKSAIGKLDWSTFWISGGFFLLFLIIALIDLKTLSGLIGGAFSWGTHYFGLYWQVLMLLTFAS
ncbi:BCCT family transporter, partial [Pseudomonas fragi]|nr:BCCT family transporter [Pseudomonas sp. GC01]